MSIAINKLSKVEKAVDRLKKILPLEENRNTLSADLASAYQELLRSYVDHGRSMSKAEMTEHVDDVEAAIETFKKHDMVIFDSSGEPTGAYPFTSEQRDHQVTINGHTVHCMCALDALAVSPMFDTPTRIDSRCDVTGHHIAIDQSGHEILNGSESGDVHFGINWSSANNSCCATSLCTEMIFLADSDVAVEWMNDDPENREIFSLYDAIEFASAFFTPLVYRKTG